MKIELQEPFASIWRLGYVRTDKVGRKRLDLVNSATERTTIAYARYLMSVELNRFLTDNEEVDHIDGDCSNDCLSNLQVLSKQEHMAKTVKSRSPRKSLSLVCPLCEREFVRWDNQIKVSKRTFCSRSCNAKQNRRDGKWLGNSKS